MHVWRQTAHSITVLLLSPLSTEESSVLLVALQSESFSDEDRAELLDKSSLLLCNEAFRLVALDPLIFVLEH
jgi:hypothetical protein